MVVGKNNLKLHCKGISQTVAVATASFWKRDLIQVTFHRNWLQEENIPWRVAKLYCEVNLICVRVCD